MTQVNCWACGELFPQEELTAVTDRNKEMKTICSFECMNKFLDAQGEDK